MCVRAPPLKAVLAISYLLKFYLTTILGASSDSRDKVVDIFSCLLWQMICIPFLPCTFMQVDKHANLFYTDENRLERFTAALTERCGLLLSLYWCPVFSTLLSFQQVEFYFLVALYTAGEFDVCCAAQQVVVPSSVLVFPRSLSSSNYSLLSLSPLIATPMIFLSVNGAEGSMSTTAVRYAGS